MSNGAFQISRTIWESEINDKPAEWFKIWTYIISRVNFEKTKQYERGEGYFNLPDVSFVIKVKIKTIYNFIAWAKSRRQISTRKSTRGIYIKVLNYDKYQTLDNYKKQTEKHNHWETEGRQKGDRRETIVEELKNVRNKENNNKLLQSSIDNLDDNISYVPEEDKPKDKKPKQYGNQDINDMLNRIKKEVSRDDFKDSQKYQRIYGKHLCNLEKKIGNSEFVKRLKDITSDNFKLKNCGSLKYIYGEIKSAPTQIKNKTVSINF